VRRLLSAPVCLAACAAFAAALRGAEPAADPGAPGPESPAFLVFPVTSDEKGLGDQVRLMLRAKAHRLGAVVFDPSSVAEALAGETVTLATPTDRLAQLARDRFAADVAVVGHVAGAGPYEIRLRVVYPGRPADARTVEKTLGCAYHQVIPLEVAKAVYDILGIPIPPDPWRELRGDPEIQHRWRDGPNLVANPGFEQANAAGDGPADWQSVEKEMAWTANPDGPGKVLTYRMSAATAGSYGLDFYSDYIPIEPGAVYRFSCRYKTLGPTVKIFLKGCHPFEAQDGQPPQRRETYRRQVHPSGGPGEWHTVEADFVPSATRPEHAPTFLRVDLYAYWPEGVVYWDDVVLKKVRDTPPGPPPAPTDAEPLDTESPPEAKEMP